MLHNDDNAADILSFVSKEMLLAWRSSNWPTSRQKSELFCLKFKDGGSCSSESLFRHSNAAVSIGSLATPARRKQWKEGTCEIFRLDLSTKLPWSLWAIARWLARPCWDDEKTPQEILKKKQRGSFKKANVNLTKKMGKVWQSKITFI